MTAGYDGRTIAQGDLVKVMALGWGVTTPMTGGPWRVVKLGPRRARLRAVGWYWHREVTIRYDQLQKIG